MASFWDWMQNGPFSQQSQFGMTNPQLYGLEGSGDPSTNGIFGDMQNPAGPTRTMPWQPAPRTNWPPPGQSGPGRDYAQGETADLPGAVQVSGTNVADAFPGGQMPLPQMRPSPSPTLPTAPQQPQQQQVEEPRRPLEGMRKWIGDNRNQLMQIGTDIASNPFGPLAGFAQGDTTQARQLDVAERDKASSKSATDAVLKLMASGKKISSAQFEYLKSNPEVAQAVVQGQIQRAITPQPRQLSGDEVEQMGLDATKPWWTNPEGGPPETVSGSGQTFNIGPQGEQYPDPPSQTTYARNEDGSIKLFENDNGDFAPKIVPMIDSKPERALEDRTKAELISKISADSQLDVVMSRGELALSQINVYSAGPLSRLAWIGGNIAADLEANLMVLRSAVGLDKLDTMKKSSKTGSSGLGALSEREMDLLTASQGSLSQLQSPTQLRYNVENVLNSWKRYHAIEAAFAAGVRDPAEIQWIYDQYPEVDVPGETTTKPKATRVN